MSRLEKLQEKCGILGIVDLEGITAQVLHEAANPIQGRGQDAAGFSVRNSAQQTLRVSVSGKIDEAFSAENTAAMDALHPEQALFQNRYATSGKISPENTQPIHFESDTYSLWLAHNGNLPQECVTNLRSILEEQPLEQASDSHVLAAFLFQERAFYPNWEETILHSLPLLRGAFSLLLMTENGDMFALKDPWGIRPLAIGQTPTAQIVSSESVSFDAIGAEYLRELEPGELRVYPRAGKPYSRMYAVAPQRSCVLETHYFARKESFNGTTTNEQQRLRLGQGMAQRFLTKGFEVDCVVPVLNSGFSVAQGFAQEIRLPLTEAIQRNPLAQRSFIMNDDQTRTTELNHKHVLVPEKMSQKRIALLDDSIVRGNSLFVLLQKINELKDDGPKEIHVVLGAPPVVDACDLGVAISSREELFVTRWTGLPLEEMEVAAAKSLGVTSVSFSTPEIVKHAMGEQGEAVCDHCFGGKHPLNGTAVPLYSAQNESALRNQKVAFLGSGNGSNIDFLLAAMELQQILAQPTRVITNNPKSHIFEIAQNHSVPATLLYAIEGLNEPIIRERYFENLLEVLLSDPMGIPDVIVLAGWNLIISDSFLLEAQKLKIDVINLHPALLSGKGQGKIMTSKGEVPEIRGAKAIEKAFSFSLLEMPVTGVTVHHLEPAHAVDTGKVILKQEVARYPDQTLLELTKAVHDAEYQVFSVALQKVLLEKLFLSRSSSRPISNPKVALPILY